jgi:hypothetical protein
MNLFQHYFHKNKGILVTVLVIIFYFAIGLPTNVGGPWHFDNHINSELSAGAEWALTGFLIVVILMLMYIPYQTWKRTKK